jgi:hypothetical protein
MENPNTSENIDIAIEAVEQRLKAKKIPIGDGVLHNMELLTKYDNRNKEQEFIVVSLEKEIEKKEERFLKRLEAQEKKAIREEELLGTAIQHMDTNVDVPDNWQDYLDTCIPIKSKRVSIDNIIGENELLRNSLIHETSKPYEQYGQTHTLNIRTHYNKYGKMVTNITANTKQADSMRQLKSKNFGCLQDLEIDTIPLSMFRGKGMEKIALYEQEKQNRKGEFLISRRFISKAISFWAYMTGMKYIISNKVDKRPYALRIWGEPRQYYGLDNKAMLQFFGTGQSVISIITDFLYIIRNKKYTPEEISPELNSQIQFQVKVMRKVKKGYKPEDYIKEMKDRMYYDYTDESGNMWSYPKLQPDYLIGILNELMSKRYALEQEVALIYDLWNFPIKCTDMNLRPLTNEQHDANKDDYDLSAIVFERE